MFSVLGSFEGIAYKVVVDGDSVTPTPRIGRMLEVWSGEQTLATPTGPAYKVDPDDPVSVYVVLLERTEVTAVTGDPPRVIPPDDPTRVY